MITSKKSSKKSSILHQSDFNSQQNAFRVVFFSPISQKTLQENSQLASVLS